MKSVKWNGLPRFARLREGIKKLFLFRNSFFSMLII